MIPGAPVGYVPHRKPVATAPAVLTGPKGGNRRIREAQGFPIQPGGTKRPCAPVGYVPRDSKAVATDPCVFAVPKGGNVIVGDGKLCRMNPGDKQCTQWVYVTALDLATRESVAAIAAQVTKAVTRVFIEYPGLRNGCTLGSVKIEFCGRWKFPSREREVVESIEYKFNGSVAIVVRVLNSRDDNYGLCTSAEAEILTKMLVAGGPLLTGVASESVPEAYRVMYVNRGHYRGPYFCPPPDTEWTNDWYNPRRFAKKDEDEHRPIEIDCDAETSRDATGGIPFTGSIDQPLFVREVLHAGKKCTVWTSHEQAQYWAMVARFDFVNGGATPDDVKRAAAFAHSYVMYALEAGLPTESTGIVAPASQTVRSLTAYFPEGTPDDIAEVTLNFSASPGATIDLSIAIVPLCDCMRTTKYLLDELDKTPCRHSFEDVLLDFEVRRLHEARSIVDSLSSPQNLSQVSGVVSIKKHPFTVKPMLTAWCTTEPCPFSDEQV
jgi:hypothetical protein